MSTVFRLRLFAAAAAVIVLLAGGPTAGLQRDGSPSAAVDQVFARWTDATPGCAVGVSRDDEIVLERAYGLADLEHDVKNAPDTIFEAGSVSKQFTAAAVLLLAHDGRLSLDDEVRQYIPELPDYGAPLTIRHLLNHTSGLRDWGSVAGIAGWPRTTRVHTHAHVLDIVSRQRALNFPSGTRYSYSNTGYNLSVVLVSRVSGMSFAEFTRTRLFEPLGMTRTSWRDDYRRIVEDRAIAYSEERGGGFRLNMPFENVHGNGGLLTTVGDLLRWTANFSTATVGGERFVREMQEPGRFNDGVQHDYALGLRIASYKGVREVGHSGSTAGYRAYLARYPDQGVAVAVLCNVSSGNAGRYAHAVADLYLGSAVTEERPANDAQAAHALTAAELEAAAGNYRDVNTGEPLRLVAADGALRLNGDTPLRAETGTRFAASGGRVLELHPGNRLRLVDSFGRFDEYQRVPAADAKPRPFAEYAGTYVSDEAEVTYVAAVEDDALVLKRRPDDVLRLTPVYADGFRSPIGFIRFTRGAGGAVTGFHVSQERVWKLMFEKVKGGETSTR